MNKKLLSFLLTLTLLLGLLSGCGDTAPATEPPAAQTIPEATVPVETAVVTEAETTPPAVFDLDSIPPYASDPYIPINNNLPFFTEEEITDLSFEYYAPLDGLGRCGRTLASIGPDLMPTEKRGNIGMVKPTGWQTVKYDWVDGKYLYNRCHLIGFQLTGENANHSNLITGTRYLNIEGMLPFENMTADYIKETGNHVMYAVTPIFTGDNLVADGVLMEGWSVEDQGEGICFCVYAYNVQPGVVIDYATGVSHAQEGFDPTQPEPQSATVREEYDYVLNTNSRKFHLPDCPSVGKMKESNREAYHGTREDLIADGYAPCGQCHP